MGGIINDFKIDKETVEVSSRPIPANVITDSSDANQIAKNVQKNTSYFRPQNLEDKILEVTGKTLKPNSRTFSITGSTPDRVAMSEGKIKFLEVDGNKYELKPELKVEIKRNKSGKLELTPGSLEKINDLAANGTVKQSMFGERIRLDRQSTISSLEHTGDMKAAMAQVNNPAADFKSSFNNVPNKQQSDNKAIS